MPSEPASAKPASAAFRVWEEVTLIAGNAKDLPFAVSSISAYFSGVAMGMRGLLGQTRPDVANPSRVESYRSVMITITPQARAIAALPLSVLLILGHLNRIWLAFALLLGDSYPSGRGGQFLTALVTIAIAVAVGAYALAAVRVVEPVAGWSTHVAGAAVVVAAVGILIAVLLGFGSVVNGSTSLPGSAISGAFGL